MPQTILLVEDDEPFLAMIASTLEEEGYTVLSASNAADAEAIWTNPGAKIDLLLTDVRLSEVDDGFALAEKFLKARPDVPVIFVSGDPDCFSLPSIRLFGDAPFIAKPFDITKMLAAVAQILEQGGTMP